MPEHVPSRAQVRPRQLALIHALVLLVLAFGLGIDAPEGCGGGGAPPMDEGFRERQRDFLVYAHENGGEGGVHTQMARLALGEPVQEAGIRSTLDDILARPDEADFSAMALTRLLYLADRHGGLDPELAAEVEDGLLGFRYWFDEGTEGATSLTENHQITYQAAEYLMGQRLPDTVFHGSGITGAEHVERVRPRLLRWLTDRKRFGYSEWLSEIYYGIDIAPLVSLVDFAEDEEIRQRAAIALDLLIYDLALNGHHGWMGSTRGRAPSVEGKFDLGQNIVATPVRILFGEGAYRSANESAGAAIATSDYAVPRVLAEIARDRSSFVTRQRNGIDVSEGPRYGYGYESDADGVFWYGMGAWSHPRVAPLTVRLGIDYGLVPAKVDPEAAAALLEALSQVPDGLLSFALALPRDITAGSMYDRTNIITYRSAHGTLSSAQDEMKGLVGFQQHAWQATFDRRAMVFTTHPGPIGDDSGIGGGDWLGGSSMPRVGQHRNVALILYDAVVEKLFGGLLADFFPDLTHAYFPKAEFDEVRSAGHWNFGRKDDGYVALYSEAPPTWTTEGEFADREITAPGARNVWICELGNADEDGSFDDFVAAVTAAAVEVDGTTVQYDSPSRGLMSFGWDAPLVVAGVAQHLGPHPRYENPFSSVRWGARRAVIEREGTSLVLDFDAGTRTGS